MAARKTTFEDLSAEQVRLLLADEPRISLQTARLHVASLARVGVVLAAEDLVRAARRIPGADRVSAVVPEFSWEPHAERASAQSAVARSYEWVCRNVPTAEQPAAWSAIRGHLMLRWLDRNWAAPAPKTLRGWVKE